MAWHLQFQSPWAGMLCVSLGQGSNTASAPAGQLYHWLMGTVLSFTPRWWISGYGCSTSLEETGDLNTKGYLTATWRNCTLSLSLWWNPSFSPGRKIKCVHAREKATGLAFYTLSHRGAWLTCLSSNEPRGLWHPFPHKSHEKVFVCLRGIERRWQGVGQLHPAAAILTRYE